LDLLKTPGIGPGNTYIYMNKIEEVKLCTSVSDTT